MKNSNTQKTKVIKITADKHKDGFDNERYEILDTDINYKVISHPIYNFFYEEVKKMRAAESKEKTPNE